MIPEEVAVLGTVMLVGRIPTACLDRGLTAEHFEMREHAMTYARMLELHDQGKDIDIVTLPEAERFAGSVPNPGAIDTYVEKVLDNHRWRTRKRASAMISDSFTTRDEDMYAQAERLLAAPLRATVLYDKQRLGYELLTLLEAGEVEALPWPFPRLAELVQMKRGAVTIVAGWTSHGKTTFVDQCARTLNRSEYKVIAWINEMTPIERAQRNVSAVSGIDLSRILRGKLRNEEYGPYVKALESIPFDIVDATGWSMEEISRDVRQRRPDVAIVDILHLIPYRDERDLARISQILNACAKQAECHVLATAHLNEKFVVGAARPQPTLGTIKGASALKQDADNVLFVWREDDPDTGLPTNVGQVYFAKARQGQVGGVPVNFDGEHSEFHAWDRDYAIR